MGTPLINYGLFKISNKIQVHECDLRDFSSTIHVINIVKPDIIFHLASYANVRASFDTPSSVLDNNILGTSNLFEAVRFLKVKPIILMCSTSEVYGQVSPKNVPINEDYPFNPASPYVVSKISQDLLGLTYFKSYQRKG